MERTKLKICQKITGHRNIHVFTKHPWEGKPSFKSRCLCGQAMFGMGENKPHWVIFDYEEESYRREYS